MLGGRVVRILVVGVSLAAGLVACGSSHPRGGQSAVTTIPPASSTSSVPPTTSKTSPCSNASVVQGWSISRRASQLVVAPVLNFDSSVIDLAARDGLGGILFLGSASVPPGLAAELRAAPAPLRLLVMADEEGGGIQRLAGAVPAMPWPRTMAATMTPSQVKSLAASVGSRMAQLGVNVDLAPVLDLDARPGPSATNPDGNRSFSADPAVATSYGLAFMQGMTSAGVLPVVKHFPGLGGASGNTDVAPASTLPLATLEGAALIPFRSAVAAGAQAVMISNATVPGLTSLPASLSPDAVDGLLRRTVGFRGLVLTDSLSAGAISDAGYGLAAASVKSVEAGADMVLFGSTLTAAQTALLSPSNVSASVKQIVDALVAAVASGGLATSQLDAAVERVLAAKHTDLCHGP